MHGAVLVELRQPELPSSGGSQGLIDRSAMGHVMCNEPIVRLGRLLMFACTPFSAADGPGSVYAGQRFHEEVPECVPSCPVESGRIHRSPAVCRCSPAKER